jgi:type II secretory pathway component PulM
MPEGDSPAPLKSPPADAALSLPELPRSPWVFRASRWQLVLLCFLVGLFVFSVSMTIDLALYYRGSEPIPMFSVSDGLAALIAAIFALTVVRHASERRKAVLQRLQMVAELNHHIRNALEIIQLTAHFTDNTKAIAAINEAATRIDRALKEILPPNNNPTPP